MLRLANEASVLYVEDEPTIRIEITEMLETLFSHVVAAENGAEGLAHFRAEEFLLVITDINMPVMDGLEFIRAIQEARPGQAILVTSAHSDAANLIPLINMGVGSFVLKPLKLSFFFTQIYNQLSGALAAKAEARYQKRLELDITKRTERLLVSQQKVRSLLTAKDTMLALVSHELRTPLNGILGYLGLIKEKLIGSEEGLYLDIVEESTLRLDRSTGKALDYSRLTMGERPLRLAVHPVEDLFQLAWERSCSHGDIVGRCSCEWTSGRDGVLTTDAELMVDVLANLIENSAKYAGERPRILVSFQHESHQDCLTVRDCGPGFPLSMASTLFHTFASGNIMHHAHGLGLGLALVDVITQTLGGQVRAVNHPEGGAVVELIFPAPAA